MEKKVSPRINTIDSFNISDETKALLKSQNVNLCVPVNLPVKYDKKTFLRVYRGYDFLENLALIRTYIKKKYHISTKLLDIILYLGPKQFFTKSDYVKFPKEFTYLNISNLTKTEFFKTIINSSNESEGIFSLSARGKSLLIEFYECLSGEKQIEFDSRCPFMLPNTPVVKINQKRVKFLKEVYEKPISESKKALFNPS